VKRSPWQRYEKHIAEWCPIGAIPFFAMALWHKAHGRLDAMRLDAKAGARTLRWLRPVRPQDPQLTLAL
jgi:hypothetical protein